MEEAITMTPDTMRIMEAMMEDIVEGTMEEGIADVEVVVIVVVEEVEEMQVGEGEMVEVVEGVVVEEVVEVVEVVVEGVEIDSTQLIIKIV